MKNTKQDWHVIATRLGTVWLWQDNFHVEISELIGKRQYGEPAAAEELALKIADEVPLWFLKELAAGQQRRDSLAEQLKQDLRSANLCLDDLAPQKWSPKGEQ